MRTNVLDIDVEYVIMISEHTFERRKEGRIHMKNKIIEMLDKLNEQQLKVVFAFIRGLLR